MKHITSDILVSLFDPPEIIEIVKQGIINHANGLYQIPERMHINHDGSTSLIMPAFGPNYNCTKLVSVTPQNTEKNLPVINGILVLNKNQNGKTVATMDAPMITALRTAAVGAIGLHLIWQQKKLNLGIIGLGVQGLWQTIFAASLKAIHEIYCTSRNKKKFPAFKNEIEKWFPGIKIVYCDTSDEVVRKSHVIIGCTTSKNPVFTNEEIDISKKRFISVGSFKKSMQELPDFVYKNADALLIDAVGAKTEVGDVIHTINNNWIPDSNIVSISDVLTSKKSIVDYNNIVFKSVGMAAFDLALAIATYEKTIKDNY